MNRRSYETDIRTVDSFKIRVYVIGTEIDFYLAKARRQQPFKFLGK